METLRDLFNKAAHQMDKVSLALVSSYYVVLGGLLFGDAPDWSSALRGATVGTVFNEHKERYPKKESAFKHYFNYFGFQKNKSRMGAAFVIGAALGTVTGECARVLTGSNALANVIAGPLAYCLSALISATAAPLKKIKPFKKAAMRNKAEEEKPMAAKVKTAVGSQPEKPVPLLLPAPE